jgi:hypothetical protein
MKLAPPRQLTLPALSSAFLLTMLVGAAACGDEAAIPNGTGGTGTNGGSSAQPVGGSSAGTSAPTAGTNNMPMAGTGSNPIGGTGPSAGTGSGAGTGPTAGTGPSGGAGGSSAGGTGPMAGTSAGGTTGDLKDIASMLNGAMLTGKCLNKTAESVCQTLAGACPGANADAALSGVITTDKMITLGGEPAKVYTITLHVQGEVESKKYDGGADQSSTGASPKADGFCVGGTPSNGDAYNVYMARVSSPKKDYFFNSIQPPGVSNHTTYGIDYTAKITANGGATIRLVAADKNCSMIRNCGPQENSGNACSAPITLGNIDPIASSKNPTFDFTQAFDGQWVVMVVTDVTAG